MFAVGAHAICGVAVTLAHAIRNVAATDAPVAACTEYHAIGARAYGVTVNRAGYHSCNYRVWSRHGREYLSWLWGGCLVVLGKSQ